MKLFIKLDGELAYYSSNKSTIGKPVRRIVNMVKNWRQLGHEVIIATDRFDGKSAEQKFKIQQQIEGWCHDHLGFIAPIVEGEKFNE